MPTVTPAAMTQGLRDVQAAPAPAPAVNRKYQAIGTTLRWLQDGRKPVELFTDDSGEVYALPQPILACLMSRVERAVAERITAD